MAHIPTEVIWDILCRLPVDTLLRIRSVCRLWRRLIDDPHFIKIHLNRSTDLKISKASTKFYLNGDSSLYSVSLDSLNAQITDHAIDIRAPEVNHPIERGESSTLVMGTCNGLILISNDVKDWGLWNPSTRKYRKLPNFKFKQPQGLSMCQYHAGLGYDQRTDDYKVLRIMQACNLNNREVYAETMVFSLQLGTWKRIKDFPFWITQDVGGVYALGALHWVATGIDGREVIYMTVALDLRTQEYDIVQLPLDLGVATQVDFGALEGCLCMSCNYIMDRVDIWLMKKDHGKTECWTKLLSVAQTNVNWCMKNVKLITYSSSGKEVLLEKDHQQLMWYDLEKKLVTKIRMPCRPRIFNAVLCLESLVQVNGDGDGVGKNTDKAENKQRQHKKR